MKLKIIFITGIIIVAVVALISFYYSQQPKIAELGNLTYEELCKKNRDVWMEMEPVIDGKKISNEKCFGCMIGKNHFCDVNDYVNYIKNLKN